MFKHVRQFSFFSAVLCFCLLFTACTTSAILTALNGIVDAGAAAVGVVTAIQGSGGLSAATADTILQYVESASTAASAAINEWNSGDTDTQKITVIIADFANVAEPALGTNTSTAVQASITAISAAISSFLAQIHSASVTAQAMTVSSRHKLPSGMFNRHRLHSIQSKANQTILDVQILRAKLHASSH